MVVEFFVQFESIYTYARALHVPSDTYTRAYTHMYTSFCANGIYVRADIHRARRKPFNLAADSREIIGSGRYISVISSALPLLGGRLKGLRVSRRNADVFTILPVFTRR